MAKSKEQSAIDAIYALVDRVDLLDKKIEIVDTNIKHLNNKVSQLLTSSKPIALPSARASAVAATSVSTGSESVDKLVLGPVKVFGRIVDNNMVPIPDVAISVYDSSSDLIKSEISNADGYWEVRLPAGKYGVEYSHSRFKTINRTVNLENGIKTFEVR